MLQVPTYLPFYLPTYLRTYQHIYLKLSHSVFDLFTLSLVLFVFVVSRSFSSSISTKISLCLSNLFRIQFFLDLMVTNAHVGPPGITRNHALGQRCTLYGSATYSTLEIPKRVLTLQNGLPYYRGDTLALP